MAKRPFRFSMQAYNADSPSSFKAKVRRAEDEGYSVFHLADHYLGPGPAAEAANHAPQGIAAIPTVAMMAEMTTRMHVGCRVFCVSYRPATVMIKEAMTIDYFSGGRLELGLGAGWIRAEYEAIGVPYDDIGDRITRLEETIQVAKQHMGGGIINVDGKFVHAVGFQGTPQTGRKVPIMIGGGSPRVLKLAGREADIASINFNNGAGMMTERNRRLSTKEETLKKIRWIKEGAGERFDDVEIEIGLYMTKVTDDREGAIEQMARQTGMDIETMREFPHAMVGSVNYICEELERRREEYGISYFTVMDRGTEGFAPVLERLAGK